MTPYSYFIVAFRIGQVEQLCEFGLAGSLSGGCGDGGGEID